MKALLVPTTPLLGLLGMATTQAEESPPTRVESFQHRAQNSTRERPLSSGRRHGWSINESTEFTGAWYDDKGAERGFVALTLQ